MLCIILLVTAELSMLVKGVIFEAITHFCITHVMNINGTNVCLQAPLVYKCILIEFQKQMGSDTLSKVLKRFVTT